MVLVVLIKIMGTNATSAFYCVIATTIIWLHGLNSLEIVVVYRILSSFRNPDKIMGTHITCVPQVQHNYSNNTHMHRNADHKDNYCVHK